MAGKQALSDNYANRFYATVTETAANTMTYAEVQTAQNIFSRQAWIIHRLEWIILQGDQDKLVAAGDYINFGLFSSNMLTTWNHSYPQVIDLNSLGQQFLTSVGAYQRITPLVKDFSAMPGGGLIVNPKPLYVGIQGVSLVGGCSAAIRGWFTMKDLSDSEFLDMVDFYRIIE